MSTSPDTYHDKELLARIAQGDEAAFEILYKRFAPKIFSAAMSYTSRDKVMSEDIVQVLFIKVWTNRHKLQNIESISDYLFIAARNLLFDTLKKQASYEAHTDDIADTQTPTQVVEQKEFDLLHEKAISALPPQQQTIYRLARLSQVPHETIAQQTGLKLSTVRTHLKLAVRSVRTFIGAHLSEPIILLPVLLKIYFFSHYPLYFL